MDNIGGQAMGTGALVIGYGSALRRDDAVGLEVAAQVEARGLPDVRVIAAHQLLPELAEPLSEARVAVFVDARVTPVDEARVAALSGHQAGGVELSVVVPSAERGSFAHAAAPGALLALAATVYGRVPRECWLVTIPASDTSLGEGLSAAALAGVDEAVRLIDTLVYRAGEESEQADS